MRLVVVATDGLALRNTTRLAAAMDLEMLSTGALEELKPAEAPAAVVIDLEVNESLSVIAQSKARWPQAMVIGLVSMPGGEAWKRAEAAGCDLVTTRGAVAKSVPKKLARWMEAPGARMLRLFPVTDVAGRLGLVDRLEDVAGGPLAIYHVGGEICAVRDVCPHAGARLSYGEVNVDEGVVTCPEHGSQFGVCTGDRRRGPADDELDTFKVVVEDGQVYIQLDFE
jgi:nitrite reductase/ring-hydroxylating ferredoxin subunit